MDVALPKAPTGIEGFDAITGGGLPLGRPTLLCGGPGCGKTIFAVEFLVNGIERFGEPGVFVAFEETASDLSKNVASLGHDLEKLSAAKKLAIDWVHVDPSTIEEAGVYTLDGLFVRLEHAVRSVGAKRLVIDTLEILFGAFKDHAVLRAELQRLFRWIKDHGLTAVVTAERGQGALTRHGLEEYVSDCVVLLDQKVVGLVTTRRMRVVKYRGSSHGTNEYPFLIDARGISVFPMSSVHLDYEVSSERVSTGVPDLDEMLGGKGYFRTSTILVSGAAGTGKSSIAASLVDDACRRGRRCIVFALEESPAQIVRNMRSVGIDLQKWLDAKLLLIKATRPSLYGIEMHLLTIQRAIEEFSPRVVIVDPISSLTSVSHPGEVQGMMVRLFDTLKLKQITGFMTYLASPTRTEETEVGVSSLIDTWIEVRDLERHGERTRGLYVIKSRGMPHSNQVREFVIRRDGLRLLDVYPGPDGIVTGSARALQDAHDAEAARESAAATARAEKTIAQKKKALEAHVAALEAELASESEQIRARLDEQKSRTDRQRAERVSAATRRSRAGGTDRSSLLAKGKPS